MLQAEASSAEYLYDGLTRQPNWRRDLTNFISQSQRANLRLDWVRNSCGSWAGEAVHRVTGVDPFARFFDAHPFRTPLEAARGIKAAGYRDIIELMQHYFREITVAEAWQGDLCLFPARQNRTCPQLPSWLEQYADPQQSLPLEFPGEFAYETIRVMCAAIGVCYSPYAYLVVTEGFVKAPLCDASHVFSIGH